MEKGFTLIELLIVLALITIILSSGFILTRKFLDYFYFQSALNTLVVDLNWARNKAIASGNKYGVAFSDTKAVYYLIKERESGEVIKAKEILAGEAEIKKITLPNYKHDDFSEITHGVFFQELGNLAGHNGRVRIGFKDLTAKEIVYSSNAGELNLRQVDDE